MTSIIARQETHASNSIFKNLFSDILPNYKTFASHCPDNLAAGGVAMCTNPSLFLKDAVVEFVTIVPGRAIGSVIKFANTTIKHLNLHNFGLSQTESDKVCRWLRSGAEEAKADPTDSASLADGDWNFNASGSSSYRLDASGTAAEATHSAGSDRKLIRALESYIEIKSEEASHYCRATESLCNLDRTYACFPAWLCVSCNVSATAAGDPTALSNQGLSDHAPIVFAMSLKTQSKHASGAIHNAVCRDPSFRQLHDAYCRPAFLDELDHSERWRLHTEIITECAQRCRN